jgi:hypothetical protein
MMKIVSQNRKTLIFYNKKLILCYYDNYDNTYSKKSLLSEGYINNLNCYLFLHNLGLVSSIIDNIIKLINLCIYSAKQH